MFDNNNDRTCSVIDEFVNRIKIIKKYFVGDFIDNMTCYYLLMK